MERYDRSQYKEKEKKAKLISIGAETVFVFRFSMMQEFSLVGYSRFYVQRIGQCGRISHKSNACSLITIGLIVETYQAYIN